MDLFFKSSNQKNRFVAVMQQSGKIYNGKLDQEYAAAVYILMASLSTWEKVSSYVSQDGIDFPAILNSVDLSHGHSVLVKLAGNLFNGDIHIDPVELMRLDAENFNIALSALVLRRKSYHVDEFK